jgi:hypothetical protein
MDAMIQALHRIALQALAGLSCMAGGVAFAQGAQLAALGRLDPGLWELRSRDGGGIERICLEDGRRLIQLRHAGLSCRQFVTEQATDAVTVHYTCAGQGSGRTHLRLESPRLVQVESSGVAGKLPFDFSAEARRVGTCAADAG